jgi:hypothetical protein
METRVCQTETGETLATSDPRIEVGFMTTARFFAGALIVALAAVCLVVVAKAQSIPDEVRLVRPEVWLITPEEGEAIVQTAWELRRGLFPKPDCSQFVHAIYSRAGFACDYAQAADLFDGIASFRRVKKTAAWRLGGLGRSRGDEILAKQ